jgi:hypothetical protein
LPIDGGWFVASTSWAIGFGPSSAGFFDALFDAHPAARAHSEIAIGRCGSLGMGGWDAFGGSNFRCAWRVD